MSTVRIGTSGWSYPSGAGTWNGLFYPATRSKKAGTAGFDEAARHLEAALTISPDNQELRDVLARVPAAFKPEP
jgi:hypothetical protein